VNLSESSNSTKHHRIHHRLYYLGRCDAWDNYVATSESP